MSHLGGTQLLRSATTNNPRIGATVNAPDLWVVAAATRAGGTDLMVINASPGSSVRSLVTVDGELHKSRVHVLLLDGPSPTAFNTPANPDNVTTVSTSAEVGNTDFFWTFPAHSITMLQLSRQPPEFVAAGKGQAPGSQSPRRAPRLAAAGRLCAPPGPVPGASGCGRPENEQYQRE